MDPVRAMDVLASVLDSARLAGRVFCRAPVTPPWGLTVDPSLECSFHVVVRGSCLLAAGGPPIRLGAGDVVLLPHGDGHALCDDLASARVPLAEWRARSRRRRTTTRAAATELICGAYEAEAAAAHPVLRLLPRIIHVADQQATPLRATVSLLDAEFAAPDVGSSKVISRLLDVLLIQALRAWLDDAPPGRTGWLGALRDDAIGRALVELHRAPGRGWTVKSLATAAGLSRPVFARRFKDKVGQPPLAYLTQLRIDAAARLLATTDTPLADVARSVGYESEFAFNRAFRRARGSPPGRFRRAGTA